MFDLHRVTAYPPHAVAAQTPLFVRQHIPKHALIGVVVVVTRAESGDGVVRVAGSAPFVMALNPRPPGSREGFRVPTTSASLLPSRSTSLSNSSLASSKRSLSIKADARDSRSLNLAIPRIRLHDLLQNPTGVDAERMCR